MQQYTDKIVVSVKPYMRTVLEEDCKTTHFTWSEYLRDIFEKKIKKIKKNS